MLGTEDSRAAPLMASQGWRHSPGGGEQAEANPQYDRLSWLLAERWTDVLSSKHAAALMGQFVAAIVLIIAVTLLDHGVQNWAYGVSVGAVASFFALLSLLVLVLGKVEKVLFTAPLLGEITFTSALSLTLAVWWGVGMYVLTFIGPFVQTTNGYFAVWIGFGCSMYCIGVTLPRLKATASSSSLSSSLIGLGMCAVVVGLEIDVGPTGFLFWRQATYGMVVAVFTFAVVAVMLLLELSESPLDSNVARALHIVVVLLWGLAAMWLTFTGPFPETSNGYFGLWVGFFYASHMVLATQSRQIEVLANESLAAIWGQVIAAVVIVIATSSLDSKTTSMWAYALSVGIVALCASLLAGLILENPMGNKSFYETNVGPLTINGLLAIFLFLWWGVGAGVLTLKAPFTGTDNGYFACWLGFACSIFGIGMSSERAKAIASSGAMTQGVLIVCSLLLICTAGPDIADKRGWKDQNVYALVIACITTLDMLTSLFLLKSGQGPAGVMFDQILSVIRFVLWVVLASWCSFTGPFKYTGDAGNGYFASWVGVLATLQLLVKVFFPHSYAAGDSQDAVSVTGDGPPVQGIAPLDAVSVLPPLTPVSNSPDAQAEIVPDSAGTYE